VRAKALFAEEEDAREVVRLLAADGYSSDVTRERFAGEDDDEAAHWVVTSDAPDIALEILTEEYDAWLEFPDPPPSTPLHLPTAPKRIKKQELP